MARYFLFLLFVSVQSCKTDKLQQQERDRALTQSFENATSSLKANTSGLLKLLDEKSTDYCTADAGKIWLKKAESITNYCSKLNDLIKGESFQSNDPAKIWNQVPKKIMETRDSLLAVDEGLRETFDDKFEFIAVFYRMVTNDSTGSASIMKGLGATEYRLCIAQLLTEFARIENNMIAFCNSKVGCMAFFHYNYYPIIQQNSTVFEPGDTLEITAGVGNYSMYARPKILIGDEEIINNEGGLFRQERAISQIKGMYSIPVTIKYINDITGKPEVYKRTIRYKVK
ncbi:MAG: hypothetical protein NTW29_03145 [Bacteroidetes bacterium]|nr:hypothetical protein [Bacteroidota bacterium]